MSIRKQQELADLSLDELAERGGDASPTAPLAHAIEMEFIKRQTESHQQAATPWPPRSVSGRLARVDLTLATVL